jgi:hypothetical protein
VQVHLLDNSRVSNTSSAPTTISMQGKEHIFSDPTSASSLAREFTVTKMAMLS